MTSGIPRERVGIVGLGVGGIAAHGRAGDRYTFFEIDPVVVEIAEGPFFSFLSGSKAEVDVVVGDGRLSLLDSDDQFDILAIDAFTSDAIPVHLMTLEAVETYLARVATNGILVIHISNRHFDLEPVLGQISVRLGLEGRVQAFSPTEDEGEDGSLGSQWVVLARSSGALAWADESWRPLSTDGPLWTDDYSDILRILKL